MTQALYVYSMRVLSDMVTRSPLQRALRLWALFGQGLLNAMQSVFYKETEYIRGYFRAMRAPLIPLEKNMPHPLDADGA